MSSACSVPSEFSRQDTKPEPARLPKRAGPLRGKSEHCVIFDEVAFDGDLEALKKIAADRLHF